MSEMCRLTGDRCFNVFSVDAAHSATGEVDVASLSRFRTIAAKSLCAKILDVRAFELGDVTGQLLIERLEKWQNDTPSEVRFRILQG